MPTAPVSPLRTFRILTAALMAGLVLFGIVLSVVVGNHRTDSNGNPVHTHTPSVWMYVVIAAIGLAAVVLTQTVGYRIPAFPPNLDPVNARATAVRVYQQSMILRFAFSESVAIIAIALLFAYRSNTVLPYVLAAAIAEVLMAYHVWPSKSLIYRVQRRLDRDGGRSDLAHALGNTA